MKTFCFFNERYENNEFNIIFEELNVNFTQDEILKAISQLKTSKSPGPDRLINEFLAHLSQRLICELIGYLWSGVRPSSVRPSVRL